MVKHVLIIDTRAGNLFSLKAAIERLGYQATVRQTPDEVAYDAIVIPGQGRFGTVMENLRQYGWEDYLNRFRNTDIPMLGICVGMQIFFEASEEDPGIEGMCWYKGQARALDFPKKPMVGWTPLKSDYWDNELVYFVNSYAIERSEHQVAGAHYGVDFCAAVQDGNFTGVQFHPEKSGETGSQLIRQVLSGVMIRNHVSDAQKRKVNSLIPRIIVCLDVDKGRVVKGTNFKELRDMGDPVELAVAYEEQGADELVFLDISASNEMRPTALKRVTDIANHLSIPFTVGGGLRELDDVKAFLDAGADKVALNTTAIQKPHVINETARAYGSQCVVVAIDVDRQGEELPIFIHGGRTKVENNFFDWTREVADRGAGEILLTCMHRDGTGIGFDTDLTQQVSEQVNIQVIASGGAKTEQHFLDAFNHKADACLAAGMFHSGNYRVEQVKQFLSQHGIAVR